MIPMLINLCYYPMRDIINIIILFRSPYDNPGENRPNFPLLMNLNDYNESDITKIKFIPMQKNPVLMF